MKFASALVVMSLSVVCLGYSPGDFNQDGIVNSSDFSMFATEWLEDPNTLPDSTTGRKTGSTATFVVAAHNSATLSKYRADYICDGIDDHVQINKALAALPTAGGAVHLCEGTYDIASPININHNTKFSGVGFATILKANSSLALPIVRATYVNNITIADLAVDGANQTDLYGVHILQSEYFFVSNLYVRDTAFDGIRVHASKHGAISDVIIDKSGNHAIFVGRSSSYVTVQNVVSIRPGTEHLCIEWRVNGHDKGEQNHHITVNNLVGYNARNHGLYVQHSNRVTISNCVIKESVSHGICIEDANNVILEGCIIEKTIRPMRHGVYIANATADISVDNCIIRDTTGYSFDIYGNNCSITNCRTYGGAKPFYVENSAQTVTIANNQFRNSSEHSMIRGGNVLVQGNTWTDSNDAPNFLIYLADTADNVQIANNNMLASAAYEKIWCEDGARPTVKDNIGFNPQGLITPHVTQSPWTYTAGMSPETVYINAGTVSDISKSAITLFTNTGHTVELEPWESLVITYTDPPTVSADVK